MTEPISDVMRDLIREWTVKDVVPHSPHVTLGLLHNTIARLDLAEERVRELEAVLRKLLNHHRCLPTRDDNRSYRSLVSQARKRLKK